VCVAVSCSALQCVVVCVVSRVRRCVVLCCSELQCVAVCCSVLRSSVCRLFTTGWLRLVGSLKLWVSFAEYSLFYRALLQKRPII